MRRSLVQLYALAVCFVTLTCFAVALGVGIYDLVQIAIPDFTVSGTSEGYYYATDELFVTSNPLYRDLPKEELTKRREENYRLAVWWERRRAVQSLIYVAIITTIDAVIFVIHWLLVRRERRAELAATANG
jgi:hypothetical protein